MMEKSSHDDVIKALKEKACLKQDVFKKTNKTFSSFKKILKEMADELEKTIKGSDEGISCGYSSRGAYEAELKFAGDLLIFHMHTNIFGFDKSHGMWKTSYIKEDNQRSYCGMINIYNFLADSFKYNRVNDSGYLVARIFINNELHYFVEGKRQLGFLYNDFANAVIEKDSIRSIIESAISYSLDFDLLTPPYDTMKEVTVMEVLEHSKSTKIRTGKRLGFKFQSEDDQIK